MSVVYITEQGSSLNKEGNRLVVKKGYNKIRWFHTKDIEQIILLGNITLTSPVITFLLKNKIDTVFLSYYGKYKGRLIGEFGKNIKLRLAQFNFLTNKKNQLDVSIEYIKTKIINQIQVLRKRNKHNKYEEVTNTITKLRSLIKYDMKEVDNLDSLRGIEGIAAKYYFAVFDKLITNRNFFFKGRNRRPPKDEINAMLSLSYTLFLNKMLGQLYVVGLDPFYGALHELTFGRQSLALDLMEEFRPIIDNFILTLVNKNQIGKKHFEYNKINEEDPELSSKLPVMFSSDGMKKFVQNFSKFMKQKFFINDLNAQFQLSDILKLQCRKYIRHINNRERYKGFQWS